MKSLSGIFSSRQGSARGVHMDPSGGVSSSASEDGATRQKLAQTSSNPDAEHPSYSRLRDCQVDVNALRRAITACTDAAKGHRQGLRNFQDMSVLMDKAARTAERCFARSSEVEVLLQEATDDEELLAAVLQTNDAIQAGLQRWQTLLSLGLADMSSGASKENGISEVPEEVLSAIGADDSFNAGTSPPMGRAGREDKELARRCKELQEQVSAAEATKAAALAEMAAAHAKEINHTKGLAVRKIKELMAKIQELEELQLALEKSRAAALSRAEAAQAAVEAQAADLRLVTGHQEAGKGEDAAVVKRLEAELHFAKARLEEVKAEWEAAAAEIKRLKGAVNNLEVQLMEARDEAVQAAANREAELAAKDAELAALQGRMVAMQEDLQAAEDFKRRMETAEKAASTLALELRKESVLRKKAHNQIREMKGNIRVLCRIRPAVVSNGQPDKSLAIAAEICDEFTVAIDDGKKAHPKKFEFDICFPPESSQEQVYEETQELLQSALDGYNVCVFCYGQTGSGKTHTMSGTPSAPGIIPRAMQEIFAQDPDKLRVTVSCYMLELYQDSLLDLIGNGGRNGGAKLAIKRDPSGAVFVDGAVVKAAANAEELAGIFQSGLENRKVAATKMNSESSRSHLVFTILLENKNIALGTKATSKLTFVDLAGSERVARSGAIDDKDRLDEARAINKSLSALGDVVGALTSNESFVPYRNHKLTQLMSDSLGGNAKTLMVVNISPLSSDASETKNSLEYATRVKQVTNENSRSFETREIQKLTAEISKLKAAAKK